MAERLAAGRASKPPAAVYFLTSLCFFFFLPFFVVPSLGRRIAAKLHCCTALVASFPSLFELFFPLDAGQLCP